MYCKVQDFLKDYSEESQKTLQIFQSLTDQSLQTKAYPDGRDIETISRHMIFSIGDMFKYLGIEIDVIEKKEKLSSVDEIINRYSSSVQKLIQQLPFVISDDKLNEEIEIYGEKWKVNYVLYAFLKHEIHHRAQITVLMRQAGLKVPGIYGPSKEEWKNYGMEPEE